MCLIVFGWRAHPRHDLVIAANRDEFHARPTEAAHWWRSPAEVFGGRDLTAGGAWCAHDLAGRFAAVTNVREPERAGDVRSRGLLVRDYFAGTNDAREWAAHIEQIGAEYGPFNLLVGDRETFWFVSNRGTVRRRALRPGIHAISNGHWGDRWPKTERAKAAMTEVLDADTPSPERLFETLADTDPAPFRALPNTGVGILFERFLSPVFIRSHRYGTRASTVVLRDADGIVDFREHGFSPDAEISHRIHERFAVHGVSCP